MLSGIKRSSAEGMKRSSAEEANAKTWYSKWRTYLLAQRYIQISGSAVAFSRQASVVTSSRWVNHSPCSRGKPLLLPPPGGSIIHHVLEANLCCYLLQVGQSFTMFSRQTSVVTSSRWVNHSPCSRGRPLLLPPPGGSIIHHVLEANLCCYLLQVGQSFTMFSRQTSVVTSSRWVNHSPCSRGKPLLLPHPGGSIIHHVLEANLCCYLLQVGQSFTMFSRQASVVTSSRWVNHSPCSRGKPLLLPHPGGSIILHHVCCCWFIRDPV